MRHLTAQPRDDALEDGGAPQWTVKFHSLHGRQEFDANDRGRIIRHVAQASGRMRRHGHMILLIGRRWNAVDARRMGEQLVLRNERCSGHLRHHESGVEPAVLHEKRGQAAHVRVHEERDAAFGKRAKDFR